MDYPDLKTEIKGFWSETDLYLLFICPYRKLNLFLPSQNDQARRGLWDRDVVEMFLGDDWENIRHYREFEIGPTADWIDLAVDLDHKGQNRGWRSGWKTTARIDEQADFTRLPAVYNLKFALLHLIQTAELLLKAYVEQCEPAALFVKAGSRRTIDLRTALKFTVERKPMLLSRAEYALLLEAKDFRNRIEHYEFDWAEAKFRSVCTDFLAICVLLSQALLSVSVVDAFSWDYLHDKPDPVAHYLSSVLVRASVVGRDVARRSGDLWASANPDHFVFLCLNCGCPCCVQGTRRMHGMWIGG